MKFTSATSSHSGRRKHNQDVVIATTVVTPTGQVRLVAVLDGMGGMRAGDRASQLAREVFSNAIRSGLAEHEPDEAFLRELLALSVGRAHEAVYAEGQSDPEKQGMGTTLVAAIEKDGKFLVVNVGDSRAYVWAPEIDLLQQLTHDHSLAEEAVRNGRLTAEEAARSPYAHALTRAVGSGPVPQPDVFPEPGGWFDFPSGGALVLCSDGLTGGLSDEDIKTYTSGSADVDALVENLVRAAFHGGSTDNISVVALADANYHAEGEPLPTPTEIVVETSLVVPSEKDEKAAPPESEPDTPPPPSQGDGSPPPPKPAPRWLKIIVVLLMATAFGLILMRFGSNRSDTAGSLPPTEPSQPSAQQPPPPAPEPPPFVPAPPLPGEDGATGEETDPVVPGDAPPVAAGEAPPFAADAPPPSAPGDAPPIIAGDAPPIIAGDAPPIIAGDAPPIAPGAAPPDTKTE